MAPDNLPALRSAAALSASTWPPSSLDRHPAAVYLAGLGEGSRRTMRAALETVIRLAGREDLDLYAFPWPSLRYQHTQALRAQLDNPERFAPATANKILAALRGVLRECFRLGYLTAEECERAVDLKRIKGASLPKGRALTRAELCALFRACEEDRRKASGARDAALLAVLYGGGARRFEAVSLDLADFNPDSGCLTVRRGKGGKARTMYAANGSRAALDAWLEARGPEEGPLFCPVDKAGRVKVRRMTAEALYQALHRRAQEAGVEPFGPHDFRRTFISDLLDAGADLALVQQLAGHADPRTTARYDRRPEVAKRRAAELLHVPFRA